MTHVQRVGVTGWMLITGTVCCLLTPVVVYESTVAGGVLAVLGAALYFGALARTGKGV